ncbi:MAG: hypothetical protein DSZ05_09180 [Sulfurospirillum sp.]|nr:MAG: hypothetical protein DSZ05_09180 [Sulfurospirillum sp.]
MPDTERDFMKLQTILHHFNIAEMTQEEIGFLQLHYMEYLQQSEIASLMERPEESITSLSEKFTTIRLPDRQ